MKGEKRQLEEARARQAVPRGNPEAPSPPPASSRLNLPSHAQREASDGRSVSSRSFFGRSFHRASPRSARRPARHPDADYFAELRALSAASVAAGGRDHYHLALRSIVYGAVARFMKYRCVKMRA